MTIVVLVLIGLVATWIAGRLWVVGYFVAEINNYLGPGDAGYLFVEFGRDGRAEIVEPPR